MTSFQYDIGSEGRRRSRFIWRVRNELLKALAEEKTKSSLTQDTLAKKLGVHRSELNRWLTGEKPLSLRSVADLAGALDRELTFKVAPPAAAFGQNFVSGTSTVAAGQVVSVGKATGNNSTIASQFESRPAQGRGRRIASP
jgi:transcriptional regulator with XRE-family HTH domain